MSATQKLRERLLPRLDLLYGDDAENCFQRLVAVCSKYETQLPNVPPPLWSERDIVLITYGDQVQREGEKTLATLHRFLRDHGLSGLISTVHLLPFFPYSSDDGFSVIDYKSVDPELGDWNDVRNLKADFSVMADLVLNHVSSRSEWFQGYLEGRTPYTGYFIDVDPSTDLSAVVRPRSLPLLTRYETKLGPRHVWTTFSDDQIDLNFANPDVLAAMVEILLFYLSQGVRIIRLDAIAFLWKEIGTNCMHLPQTHEVVKLFRDLFDILAPNRILLTETNVPHAENISYFGDGDEAHMVYQFSLAPLLLDALLTGDGAPLKNWIQTVCQSPPRTTYLNFTASHDGVGVRPLQGLVSKERFDSLLGEVRARGGHVSTRRLADGTDSPYELNITYLSALEEPQAADPRTRIRRFLTSQAIMLALRGVPAVYFHSLVGTPNDYNNVAKTGRARSINRRKYNEQELNDLLNEPGSCQSLVFEQMKQMLAIRIAQPAFHPEAEQELIEVSNPAVLAFRRSAIDGSQEIQVVANLSANEQEIEIESLKNRQVHDLLSDTSMVSTPTVRKLQPYEVLWLSSQ